MLLKCNLISSTSTRTLSSGYIRRFFSNITFLSRAKKNKAPLQLFAEHQCAQPTARQHATAPLHFVFFHRPGPRQPPGSQHHCLAETPQETKVHGPVPNHSKLELSKCLNHTQHKCCGSLTQLTSLTVHRFNFKEGDSAHRILHNDFSGATHSMEVTVATGSEMVLSNITFFAVPLNYSLCKKPQNDAHCRATLNCTLARAVAKFNHSVPAPLLS